MDNPQHAGASRKKDFVNRKSHPPLKDGQACGKDGLLCCHVTMGLWGGSEVKT